MEINNGIGSSNYSEMNKQKYSGSLQVTELVPEGKTENLTLTEKQAEVKYDEKNREKEANLNLLKSSIDKANSKLMMRSTRCEFKIYEDINRVAIKVIDRDSDKVIREIPPEESLELVQKLWEMAGLIVDEKR